MALSQIISAERTNYRGKYFASDDMKLESDIYLQKQKQKRTAVYA
jgi:hypothetical protein